MVVMIEAHAGVICNNQASVPICKQMWDQASLQVMQLHAKQLRRVQTTGMLSVIDCDGASPLRARGLQANACRGAVACESLLCTQDSPDQKDNAKLVELASPSCQVNEKVLQLLSLSFAAFYVCYCNSAVPPVRIATCPAPRQRVH